MAKNLVYKPKQTIKPKTTIVAKPKVNKVKKSCNCG